MGKLDAAPDSENCWTPRGLNAQCWRRTAGVSPALILKLMPAHQDQLPDWGPTQGHPTSEGGAIIDTSSTAALRYREHKRKEDLNGVTKPPSAFVWNPFLSSKAYTDHICRDVRFEMSSFVLNLQGLASGRGRTQVNCPSGP